MTKAFKQLKMMILLGALSLLVISNGPCLSQEYQVGKGDVLKVTVYDNPDLDKTVRVSSDGMIVLPLIESVQVGGLTVAQVAEKITALLTKDFLVDPYVNVFVEEYRSKSATILGEVKNPGLYQIRGNISFLEIISKAGGFTATAGNTAIIKRRPPSGRTEPETIRIDLTDFMENSDNTVDVQVADGDTIYIKKAPLLFINGQVKNPDAYKWEPGITIIKAITRAGGFAPRASTRNIKIIRKVNGAEKVMTKVALDEPVLADDVVVVPESFF